MPTTTDLAGAVLAGDPRAIARAISLVEDEQPAGIEIVRSIYPNTGNAYVVGITGPPGAGKSTLVDRLAAEVRREGKKVGVIAVDPTSPFTGGALLGDRVRMGGHSGDAGVFIRSMATRGHLGGLARATGDVALILDAAGYDVLVIETIGVGQDEIDIVRTADVSIVMLVPGTGDEVQALKAGIMEIADIFVVNKADREGADRLVQSVTANLTLQTFADGEWRPPVLKTVATGGEGISELWARIGAFREQVGRVRLADGARTRHEQRQRARHEYRLRDLLSHQFMQHVDRALAAGELDRLLDDIAARRTDPYSAATELMARVLGSPR